MTISLAPATAPSKSFRVRLNGPGCYTGICFIGESDRKWGEVREFLNTYSCSKCGPATNKQPCDHKRIADMVRASGLKPYLTHVVELPTRVKRAKKQINIPDRQSRLVPVKSAATAYCPGYGSIAIQ